MFASSYYLPATDLKSNEDTIQPPKRVTLLSKANRSITEEFECYCLRVDTTRTLDNFQMLLEYSL